VKFVITSFVITRVTCTSIDVACFPAHVAHAEHIMDGTYIQALSVIANLKFTPLLEHTLDMVQDASADQLGHHQFIRRPTCLLLHYGPWGLGPRKLLN
jgi:hypothetical protein